MKIWAIANQKGGVGKTTTAVTLGGLLARRGYNTLLVDIDPHGSLTSYFRYIPEELVKTVYTLFQDKTVDPHEIVLPTRFQKLSILPTSMALATLDKQLGAQSGMGLVLDKALNKLADQYDYALIDCPPMLGVLMVNALAACNHLVVPVQTEFLALKGLERMIRTLKMIMRSRDFQLPYTIVPTLYDRRTQTSNETLRTLKKTYYNELWESVIPTDTLFREASRLGLPLPMYEPEAKGVEAYHELLNTLLNGKMDETRAIAS